MRVCAVFSPVLDGPIQEATSTGEVLIAFRQNRPDLVVLDLNSPNSSGLELLKRLILEDKEARILVFTMHAEPIYAVRALRAGARGYVSKSAPVEELLAAVRGVAVGDQYIEPEIAFNIVQTRHLSNDPFEELTTREIHILRLLGEGKDLRACHLQDHRQRMRRYKGKAGGPANRRPIPNARQAGGPV